MKYPFYLGPLGSMYRLPSTKAKDEIGYTVERSGGIRQALGGRGTQDTWGSKQTWAFEWKEEEPEVLDFIQRMWRLTTRRPLRLLDPMLSPNLLSMQCASVGAEPDRKPLRAFDVGARSIVWSPVLDGPPDLYLIEGGLQWAVTAEDMLRGDLLHRVPLLGNPLTVSMFCRGSGSVRASVIPYTPSGAAQAAVQGPSVTLNASTWSRVSVTIPASAQTLSAVPALAAAGGTLQTVGWQAEHGSTPTPWRQGGTCPQVLLVEHDAGIIRANRRNLSLGCREV